MVSRCMSEYMSLCSQIDFDLASATENRNGE